MIWYTLVCRTACINGCSGALDSRAVDEMAAVAATDSVRVAVVGGGICGASAAAALAGNLTVTLFDQGRRGPGGRASHRSVILQRGQTGN
eukprot:3491707-Pleurochrysis_carterae.AAC.2